MNRAEMTELFAALMLAYPNAEMFKAPNQQALMQKLAPTITLWTTCLRDLDPWTAQKAVVKLCQVCKFPPTIAEMREAAEAVTAENLGEIKTAYLEARAAIRAAENLGRTGEEVIAHLPTRTQKTIDAMGGLEVFVPSDKAGFDMGGFMQTYERLLRSNPVGLPGNTGQAAIGQ